MSIAACLVVLILVAGLGAVVAVGNRAAATAELVERHEPAVATVQDVYRALSDADAIAAMEFLAAGTELDGLRARYEDDIALAGPSLGLAGFDPSADAEAAHHIGVVGRQLPVYAGLVEIARTENRRGMPVGAAYLRQASHLMRSEILPYAEALDRIQRDRVGQVQESATAFPFAAAALAAVTVGALVLAQTYVRRLAKRRFNIGLVVATVAIMVGVAWSGASLLVQHTQVVSGQRHGTSQVDLIVQSRIAALQARADELLALVARGEGAAYEAEFDELTIRFSGDGGSRGWLGEVRDTAEGALAEHVDEAAESAAAWLQAHERMRQLDHGGDYDDAVALAIDTDNAESGAAAFSRFDEALHKAIWAGRQNFVDSTVKGQRALNWLAPGWLGLAAIAVTGVVVGIGRRLREYR